MNQVQLMGNVTTDIELKEAATGKKYVQFTLAVNSRSEREVTNFIDMVAFDRLAEILSQYAKKGNKIAVEGRLSQSQYIDKEGNKRNTLKVILSDFEFLDHKKVGSKTEDEVAISKK